MRLLVITLFLLVTYNINAQNDFLETSSKLNDLVLHKAGNEIIYVNDTYLFYADLETLKVKDSVKIIGTPERYISSLDFLNTPNPLIIIKTKTKNRYYQEFYEYPEDSAYFFNVNLKTVANKFPGNLYVTFNEENPNQSVVAYNQFYAYTNQRLGEEVKSAKVGGLQAFPEKNQVASSGVLRNIKMNFKGSAVALVYYDSIGKNSKDHYTLELRSLPNLDIKHVLPITGRTKRIYFSKNDAYIILKKDDNKIGSSLSKDETIEVYDATSLERLTELPDDLFVESLIEEGSVWKQIGSEIFNQVYGKDTVTQKIWSNLTPFSVIDGFIKINKDELLIYGNKGYGFSNEKNGIYKYSLSNNAIFSQNAVVKDIDTLFQYNEVLISDNKINGDNPQLNQDKNLLQLHNENRLQIWSALDKRKLCDLEFENAINPFLSPSGNASLIFEQHTGKTFNEFKMRYLDLKSGLSRNKLFSDSRFNGLSAKCFNVSENEGVWLCSDGSESLWNINTENKTIEALEDYSNTDYYRTNIELFKPIPETKKVLIGIKHINVASNHSVTDSKFEGFKIYDYETNSTKAISGLEENHLVFPISANELIFQDGNSLKLFDLEDSSSRDVKSLSEYKISKVVTDKDVLDIILEHSQSTVDSLMVMSYNSKSHQITRTLKIPYSKGHFLNFDGFHYKDAERYYTYNKILDASMQWNNPVKLYTQSTDLSVTKDGKMLFKNEWLFNLKTLELESQIPGFYNSIVLENNKLFYVETNPYSEKKPHFIFKIADQSNLETIDWQSKSFPIKNYSYPNTTLASKDKTYVLAYENSAYKGQTLYLINLKNKTVKTKNIKFYLKSARFSEDENALVLLRDTDEYPTKVISQIFNPDSFELLSEVEARYSNHMGPNTILHVDGQYLVTSVIDGNEIKEKNTYFARKQLSVAQYLDSKSLLIAGTERGEVLFWNPDNQSPKKIIKISNSKILKIEELNNSLFILSKDSEISVVDLEDLELKATCDFFEKDDEVSMVWYTPEGYFKASKTDIRNFHFVKQGKAFPLLDYSLFLNRPDVLMQKVGFTSESIYNTYKNAYLKRLQRNNFSEQTDIINMDKPILSLQNRIVIPSITKDKNLKLEIENKSNASNLVIYSNGVPIYEDNIKNKSFITSDITLNSGLNRVSIISKSETGIESDPITFETKNVNPRPTSRVYYVGIGVSKYQDSSMNLQYADKDVRRLANVFSRKYEGRVEIDTLLNENVTKVNIQNLKAKLKETSIEDTVIISFSGHGLIGSENTFYFGTHDIDFSNPEVKGFNYGEIQDLLTGIPARRKLLLLDACHSGELDISETSETSANVTQNIPEGAKGSKARNTSESNNDTFQLMQSLFYDLDRGNGSYVISAAAGSEFAYEDEQWGNGVFTYSFVNALYDLGYDTWEGEKGIPISKIKKYVYENVKKLTNNKQQPTSRAENLEWDWVLD